MIIDCIFLPYFACHRINSALSELGKGSGQTTYLNNGLMIRVKIVNGAAIDAEELEIHEEVFPFWDRFIKSWDRIFLDKFQILNAEPETLQALEGLEFWAWLCGNGKVYLMEQIPENNLIA